MARFDESTDEGAHRRAALRLRGVMTVAVLLGMLCSSAIADERSFQITVRVLPRHPPTEALATLPLPPGSSLLTANSFGASYYFAGEPGDAAAFYLTNMPNVGYRLVRASGDGSELTWQGLKTRIELRLTRVLGARSATRIVAHVSDDR